jgi:hypothetical protein
MMQDLFCSENKIAIFFLNLNKWHVREILTSVIVWTYDCSLLGQRLQDLVNYYYRLRVRQPGK